jgi:DNA-binding transcriptional regulator LsrR (DeoR family)
LFQLVAAMRPISYPNIHVIQLVGGMGSQNPSEIGSLLAPQLADLFGCNCHYLPAPPVADSAFTRNAYMQESSIKETLELANHADIALVGVGSTNVDVNTPLKLGIISQRENDNLINHGAVGNVCSCFYNIHGEILKTDINERIVGIELSDLKKIPVVIGISAGIKKAEGILGGLRGKHINTLFTDDSTARRILELANMD